ncbi:hypothetical protein ABB37_09134 [Leptomonas pyrrhocoris]|uniref:Uncharacterized protein n=1 Tax=Leptomonas pyrrhocoris TaxID=157538 RepID=A0A0M9FRH4_LEPPY|nr:hypothetical protein ABB37_09134 [Leptomonas pyrrhocoris]XP_015652888.1 hypothetical protein ABB37_09134 [Leptomonas pyrrhocoris]KPA74448.1 hypothetical protein ABB37_09134 [Leptomonas pyrrhocoris]KPA74449.1 hypothetical protein ABB37_09134 [Leptomonas pyrrhocoris]|eukprot:XP_015652887.1 hypothetical protein ABB37_09134 [Leptomonas pyrrhocoris]
MFIIPVEKKGKYSHTLSLRFLCYDPATRMAYLSDKDAKIRQWKHRMKVYAIMPACVQGSEPINFRLWNYEAKELLSFTIAGVSHHRLDSRNAADQMELQRLPHLLNESYQDSDPSIRTYTDSAEMQRPSQQPVSPSDDANFFGRDRDDWSLRCPYYNAAHDMILLIRDTLIADGLRFPVYGGLLGGVDPRNELPLVSFPLYLQQHFHQLAGAIVYSCVHGRMIGCDPHGRLGVCMRHVYLCVTDQDVLFVAESGSVARSVPLSLLRRVEYNGPVTAGSNSASASASSASAASAPYIAFLADGETADVLFSPCSAFPAVSDDCSPSMVAAMPRMNVEKEVEAILSILTTLLTKHGVDAAEEASPSPKPTKENKEEFDADVQLGDSADSIDLDTPGMPAPSVLAVPPQPAAAAEAPEPPADPAPLPAGFRLEALDRRETVQDYAESFQQRHGRIFKWQTLPGARHIAPTVQSAASLAQSLGMHPPQRQAITRRSEFLPFYYGSAAAARAAEEQAAAMREERRERASNANSRTGNGRGGDDLYGEEVFATTVPVRRVSRIIDMFKPEQDIY